MTYDEAKAEWDRRNAEVEKMQRAPWVGFTETPEREGQQ
jgi:hypothetical protein